MPRELEIAVPRHGRDRAQEERVGVVQEPGMARVFERAEAAACHRLALEHQYFEPGLAEIGREDEPVMAGAENDRVVSCGHARPLSSQQRRRKYPTGYFKRWQGRRPHSGAAAPISAMF